MLKAHSTTWTDGWRCVGAGVQMSELSNIDANRLLLPAARSRLLWRQTAQPTDRVRLFGLTLEDTTVTAAVASWIEAARGKRRLRAVFANAHVVNEMAASPGFRAVVASADRVYADGSGLAVAARMAGRPLADNVNGTDVFPRLAAAASTAGIKIFLLGGRPGVADAARARMDEFGLGKAIVGTQHGFFAPGSADEDAAIAAANASGADIVLVAMGVPLQDEWIARHAHRLDASVLAGVGGLLDFFAGSVSRAPHAFRVVGCEWIWRLALEPRRMAHRYLIGNVKFLALACSEAVRVRGVVTSDAVVSSVR